MEKTKTKMKKRYFVLPAVLGILLIASGVFFQFTPLGYRMTVRFRNFTEVLPKVYIDNSYSGSKEEAIAVINEAKDRVTGFWGNLESSPTIIVSDDEKTIAKLGGDHDTATAVLFQAYIYISVSGGYLKVDIVAHEMTHAELHTRLYKGKLPQELIPVWFDEGVAIQNDYRSQYSDETWEEKTNHGSTVIPLDEMDTVQEFYAGDAEDRRFRYLISRHEVKSWIGKNGVDELIDLIERVNAGETFDDLYISAG